VWDVTELEHTEIKRYDLARDRLLETDWTSCMSPKALLGNLADKVRLGMTTMCRNKNPIRVSPVHLLIIQERGVQG